MTPEKRAELRKLIFDAVVEAVAETGDRGAPGGPMYAAMMAWGMDYHTFINVMAELVEKKRLIKRGELYFAVKS